MAGSSGISERPYKHCWPAAQLSCQASYLNRACLWVVITALGTVGYTLLDKLASEKVSSGPATAGRYGYFFFAIAFGTFATLGWASKAGDSDAAPVGWARPATAAVLSFAAYWLILWAYQLCPRAGYIVALRQSSVVIGVAVAFLAFKEGGVAVRLAATAVITVGFVLIGLWGG